MIHKSELIDNVKICNRYLDSINTPSYMCKHVFPEIVTFTRLFTNVCFHRSYWWMFKSNAAKHVGFKPVKNTFTRILYSLGAYIYAIMDILYILLLFIINHYQDLNVIIFTILWLFCSIFTTFFFFLIVRIMDFPFNLSDLVHVHMFCCQPISVRSC